MASSSSSLSEKPVVGVLSVGDMGMGIAKLLLAHDYRVYTTSAGRSQHTKDRIKAARISDVESDEDLVVECDIILSIVPPRDAIATAKRIQEACKTASPRREARTGKAGLRFIDLNAISPRTTNRIAGLFSVTKPDAPSFTRKLSRTLSINRSLTDVQPEAEPVTVKFLDGGIIGGPPSLHQSDRWRCPSIIVSGPMANGPSPELSKLLNMKHISDKIGSASTLKACFASFSKGIQAIAIASLTTAHTEGVLPELKDHLHEFLPGIWSYVEKGVPNVPPKAYRWIDEMKEIGETMSDQGRFQAGHEGQAMFDGISEVYKLMANDTPLGRELIGKRKRGTTVDDVAQAMQEGIDSKRAKKPADEKLELAWRGSWS